MTWSPSGGAPWCRQRNPDRSSRRWRNAGWQACRVDRCVGRTVRRAGGARPWLGPGRRHGSGAILDYQPRLRLVLEKRFGTTRPTPFWRSPARRSTPPVRRGRRWPSTCCCTSPRRPNRGGQRVWANVTGFGDACPIEAHSPSGGLARCRRGRWNGMATAAHWRSSSAWPGFQRLLATPTSAATAAVVAAPKAARIARETFSSTLARGLSENFPCCASRPDALRRLDRVDAVLVDPRALGADELRVSRIRGALDQDRAAIWQWAQADSRRARCAAAGTRFRDRGRRMAMAARVCRCWCGGHTTRLRRRWSGRRAARVRR